MISGARPGRADAGVSPRRPIPTRLSPARKAQARQRIGARREEPPHGAREAVLTGETRRAAVARPAATERTGAAATAGFIDVVGAVFVVLAGPRYDRAVEVLQTLDFALAVDAISPAGAERPSA